MPVRICIFSTFMLKSLNGDQSFLSIFFWYACFILPIKLLICLKHTMDYTCYIIIVLQMLQATIYTRVLAFLMVLIYRILERTGSLNVLTASDLNLGQRFSGIYTCLNVCFGFFVMFHFHIYRILH